MNLKKKLLISIALTASIHLNAAERFVSFQNGEVLLNANHHVEIYMDKNDCKGVSYAIGALTKDIQKVSGSTVAVTSSAKSSILVGTIGHSTAIDQLIKQKRLNGNLLKGKREKFIITLVDGQLVIAGSDRRGTIYGIYELSQQIGVRVFTPMVSQPSVIVEYSSTTRLHASPLG